MAPLLVWQAIDAGGDQDQDGGGDDVHEDAIHTAAGADGEALDHGGHDGQQHAGHRAIGEGTDQDRDIGRVILQEGSAGEDGEMDQVDQHDRDGHQHGHRGQLTNFCLHKKTLP